MQELVEELERYTAETGDAVTVMFDTAPPEIARPGDVRVMHAPRQGPDAADDEIARLVRQDSEPGTLTVITSDARLAAAVRDSGAEVVSSGRFRRRLDEVLFPHDRSC